MKVVDFFLLYFYVFSTQFVFIPGHLGTRVLIGVLGLMFFFIRILNNGINIRIKKNAISYIILLFPIALFSIITMVANGTSDAEFVKYGISMTIVFFASYFVSMRLILERRYDIYSIIDLLKYVVLLHLTIAMCAFIIPPMKTVIVGIQALDLERRSDSDYVLAARLVGLGPSFFVAGIVYIYTLILLTYKFLYKKMSSFEITKDVLAFLFIILFGIFTSRMTVVGILLSIILILFTRRKKMQNKWRQLLPSVLFIMPLIILLYMTAIYNNPDMEMLVNHGFEILQNAQDKGEASSASTNHLLQMYETYPTETSTFLLGDGYFAARNGQGYYKDIDIGYYRLIFYFGLIGTFFYFLFQYKVLSLMRNCFPNTKTLVRLLFIMVIILNLKGFADIASITLLFTFRYF